MSALRILSALVLSALLLSALASSGCLEGLPWLGSPVVYPRIVPTDGGTMPVPPVYAFPFQDRTVVVDVSPEAGVYAGAKASDKSARIYDHSIPDEEWRAGIYRALISDPGQDGFFSALLAEFHREREANRMDPDEYAELLAVFVQSIPYETQDEASPRFPVQTFVDGIGDCDDKSLLLAALLSREGYRTALLYFEPERHMAVGIGCPGTGYMGSGYAYIETTNVTLVGNPPRELAGGTTLSSAPLVISIGEGTLGYRRCSETAEIGTAIDGMGRELATLGDEIRDRERTLEEKRDLLDNEKASMDLLRSRGDLAGYNMRVAAYNARVEEYNQMRSGLLLLVERYNRIAGAHNHLVSHQYDRKGLYASLSASQAP